MYQVGAATVFGWTEMRDVFHLGLLEDERTLFRQPAIEIEGKDSELLQTTEEHVVVEEDTATLIKPLPLK